jgi:hypothetical protein
LLPCRTLQDAAREHFQNWYDSARKVFRENPGVRNRVRQFPEAKLVMLVQPLAWTVPKDKKQIIAVAEPPAAAAAGDGKEKKKKHPLKRKRLAHTKPLPPFVLGSTDLSNRDGSRPCCAGASRSWTPRAGFKSSRLWILSHCYPPSPSASRKRTTTTSAAIDTSTLLACYGY